MNLCNKSVSVVHHQSKVSKSNPHWLPVLPSVAGFAVISQKQSNEAESAVADPLLWHQSPPTGKHNDNDIWDYWFCLSWSIRGGGYALTPTTLIHSSWAQRSGRSCVTWSWWSKNVLIHALEPASQTFTLLSDELGEAEDRLFLTLFISSVSGGKSCHPFEVLPWDKVSVIWGEGDIKNPGPMSTQRASQVSMLPVKENHECWFASILFCVLLITLLCWKNTSSFI